MSAIINPNAPQAYLPASLAPGYEALSHVSFLVLGAWSWDFVNVVSEEYTIVWKRTPSIVTLSYITSRIATATAIVTMIIMQTLPTAHCSLLKYFLSFGLATAYSSGSLLFVARIIAVYDRSKVITAIFGTLWMLILGVSIAAPFSITMGHIGPTKFCIFKRVGRVGSPFITFSILTVFDTLVFVLITWRIGRVSLDPLAEKSWVSCMSSILRGNGLPQFSQSVVRHGQKYFLSTVILNVAVIVMLLTPAVPSTLHTLFLIPAVAMQNALACRIYRETLLDVTSVRTQRMDLAQQSTLQFQRDIDLSDVMNKNGLGSLDTACPSI